MSGSPKYSSVSYSQARQRALEREREERERAHRVRVQEERRRAEAAARREAARAAGMLAQLDSELAYLRQGLAFTPALASELQALTDQIEGTRSLFRDNRLAEVQAAGAQLTSRLEEIRERMEGYAAQLALRLATLDALGVGLRARGYEVGEALAQPDGTIALRASLGGPAGLDLAVVTGEAGDELVWQRHDAEDPQNAGAACESVLELHNGLRAELASTGIELGGLRWSKPIAGLQEPHDARPEREGTR